MTAVATMNSGPAQMDFMVPKRGYISMPGNQARRLLESKLDIDYLRPYVGDDGQSTYINRPILNAMGEPIFDENRQMQIQAVPTMNDTNATLTIRDWIDMDTMLLKTLKLRLKVAKDLIERGLTYNIPGGMARTVLQFQTQSDISGATISMDGMRLGESDRPEFGLVNFPLPIIHKDFQYSLREILASKAGIVRAPLDLNTVELATRRVAEGVEQLTLGMTSSDLLLQASYSYGGGTVYGYANFPSRITTTITSPAAAGWTPDATLNDMLMMVKLAKQAKHTGPYKVYCGLLWDPYMDNDYKATFNGTTLRERLGMIKDIEEVDTVDYIPDYSLILVQMDTETVRMVQAVPPTVVQWETKGGFEVNFKVLTIMVPQLRADFYGNSGVVHGSP